MPTQFAKRAFAANVSLLATFKMYQHTLKSTTHAWSFPWAAEKKLSQSDIKE